MHHNILLHSGRPEWHDYAKSFSIHDNAKHFLTVPVVKRNLKLTPISLMDGGKIKLSNVYILFKLTA